MLSVYPTVTVLYKAPVHPGRTRIRETPNAGICHRNLPSYAKANAKFSETPRLSFFVAVYDFLQIEKHKHTSSLLMSRHLISYFLVV